MERFLELKDSSKGSLVETYFDSFLQNYSECMSIIDAGVSELQKSQYVSKLADCLDYEKGTYKSWSPTVTKKALQVLRVCSREVTCCDKIFCEDGISLLLKHATIHKASEAFVEGPASTEALKCLANLLLLEQKWKGTVIYKGGFNKLVKALESHLSTESLFLVCRLLFLLTASNRPIVNQFIDTMNGLPLFYSHFIELIDSLDESDFIHSPLSVNQKPISTNSKIQAANEMLRCLYNFTVRCAAADNASTPSSSNWSLFTKSSSKASVFMDDKKDEKPKDDPKIKMAEPFKEFIPALVRLFKKVPMSHIPVSAPHSHIINSLMNLPINDETWRIKYWFAYDDYTIVELLVKALEKTIQIAFPPEKISVDDVSSKHLIGDLTLEEALPPICLLIKNMAKFDLKARAIIKAQLIPQEIDRTGKLEEGSATIHRLIQFFTCYSHENIKQITSEILFLCFDENGEFKVTIVNSFVGYFGYGHVAGFLFQKGLMMPNDPNMSQFGQQVSQSNIDPITGAIRRNEDENPFKNMTDEEKELEAEKMFVLFEKLNATGVIKAAFPDSDLGNNTGSSSGK